MDKTDPIERVHETRKQISREHPDTRSLIAHYEKLQARHAERLIDAPDSDAEPAQPGVAANGAPPRG